MTIEIVKRGAFRVGGITKLAAGLGVRHQTLYQWRKVPAERVLEFERLTGISRHEARADIYPLDDVARETPSIAPSDEPQNEAVE